MCAALDFLAFGAHPDDAELGCGGLLAKMKKLGYRTGIVHLTSGEMASRGDPVQRRREAEEAASLLDLDLLEFLDFADCAVADDYQGRLKIASVVRRLCPRIVLGPNWDLPPGRGIGHADHIATAHLVAHGSNYAHLAKLPLEGEAHPVELVLHYFYPRPSRPALVVDVSDHMECWIDAVKAHRSQFFAPETGSFPVVEVLRASARVLGRSIGAEYGNGFTTAGPVRIDDPVQLLLRPSARRS